MSDMEKMALYDGLVQRYVQDLCIVDAEYVQRVRANIIVLINKGLDEKLAADFILYYALFEPLVLMLAELNRQSELTRTSEQIKAWLQKQSEFRGTFFPHHSWVDYRRVFQELFIAVSHSKLSQRGE